MKWLTRIDYQFGPDTISLAVKSKRQAILTWLYNENKLLLDQCIYINAVNTGNKDFLIWSKQTGINIELSTNIYERPIQFRDFEMIECINTNLCQWAESVSSMAVQLTNLPALEFLRLKGCP